MQVQQGYQMPLILCDNDGNICICICTCVVDQINIYIQLDGVIIAICQVLDYCN